MQAALRNRLIFGPLLLAGLFLLLGADYLVQEWWKIKGAGIAILLLLVLPLAVFELSNLFAREKVRPYTAIAIPGSALLIAHAFATQFPRFERYATSTMAFILVLVMIMAALRLAWHKQTHEAIGHMAGTLLATLYYAGLGWFLLALRVKGGPEWPDTHFQGSTAAVLMILLVVKFTDIGGYFGGKLIGRHKLIPWLSPGKTWEGLICGVIAAALIGAVCAPHIVQLTWTRALIFGAVIGAVGQGGDLLESMMKRDAEVKDSGAMIPGFGGILDVIDSPLLAAPVAYLLFSIF